MSIKTLLLTGIDSQSIALEAKQKLAQFSPTFLIFFASSDYATSNPGQCFAQAFPDCNIIGTTSISEFHNGSLSYGSVSIMAIDKDSVEDSFIRVITDIKSHPDITGDIHEMHDFFGGYPKVMSDFAHYAGIILFEGKAKSEEYIMDKLGNATDLLFIGGSSSMAKNRLSRVYANGEVYKNAAVLALLHLPNGFDIIKTQSVELYSEKFYTVTKSDVTKRLLFELDHQPVADVYAKALGIEVSDIEAYFVDNPIGVTSDREIFVRSFGTVKKKGISMHCGIPEGTEIRILKVSNIVSDTKKALEGTITYQPAGLINFNCSYRTLEIEKKNLVEPYCQLFANYNSIGFSTFGEAFLGHMNETSTILVLK